MLHRNQKGLAKECDKVIDKFASLNFDIDDTQGEHTKMVFFLERRGYKLHARSPTGDIKHCMRPLDDCYHLNEILQDLHDECTNAIHKSKRYSVRDNTQGGYCE